MQRYFIEIPHPNSKQECMKAVEIFKNTGSHFLSNADWGCMDNEHRAWITIDAENKDDAIAIIPPWYRENSKVITVDKLALDDINKNLTHHKD